MVQMEIMEYIFSIFSERVRKILPTREVKFMPDISGIYKSYKTITELIFVLERYLDSRIFPTKCEVIKSKKFDDSKLSVNQKRNLDRLIKMLEEGDVNVNNPSYGYLPNTTKYFFEAYEGDTDNWRYQVDFSNQVFGIRHLHLDTQNKKQDLLLFYVYIVNKIYILRIGSHRDIYTKLNLKVIVEEFQMLLPFLRIFSYPDMPMDDDSDLPPDEVKKLWINGLNVSFKINDRFYTSSNLQTFSRMNSANIHLVQNLYFQVQHGLKEFTVTDDSDDKIIVADNQDLNKIYQGYVKMINYKDNEEFEIQISYLMRLRLVDCLLENIK
jgi:hypothetical protein